MKRYIFADIRTAVKNACDLTLQAEQVSIKGFAEEPNKQFVTIRLNKLYPAVCQFCDMGACSLIAITRNGDDYAYSFWINLGAK